jgi:cytochrome b
MAIGTETQSYLTSSVYKLRARAVPSAGLEQVHKHVTSAIACALAAVVIVGGADGALAGDKRVIGEIAASGFLFKVHSRIPLQRIHEHIPR